MACRFIQRAFILPVNVAAPKNSQRIPEVRCTIPHLSQLMHGIRHALLPKLLDKGIPFRIDDGINPDDDQGCYETDAHERELDRILNEFASVDESTRGETLTYCLEYISAHLGFDI